MFLGIPSLSLLFCLYLELTYRLHSWTAAIMTKEIENPRSSINILNGSHLSKWKIEIFDRNMSKSQLVVMQTVWLLFVYIPKPASSIRPQCKSLN